MFGNGKVPSNVLSVEILHYKSWFVLTWRRIKAFNNYIATFKQKYIFGYVLYAVTVLKRQSHVYCYLFKWAISDELSVKCRIQKSKFQGLIGYKVDCTLSIIKVVMQESNLDTKTWALKFQSWMSMVHVMLQIRETIARKKNLDNW